MNNFLDYNIEEFKVWLQQNKYQKFRAKQIFDWVYKLGKTDFEEMNNIPKDLRKTLKEKLNIQIPEIVKVQKSKDGTSKFLLKLYDGKYIETVVMKYKYGYSICVSTQVGCKMGCKFCASTIGGFMRNLSSGEITAQLLCVQNNLDIRISNIVLMGSGEPLDNFDNIVHFIGNINSESTVNIGQRRITLSTCGIVPKIIELADLKLQITLAISLHASSDKKRNEIMPISEKYSLLELIDSCKYYYEKTKRRISFEYALIQGKNDSLKDAELLSKIIRGFPCHVNLIPINEIEENNFKKSNNESILNFQHKMLDLGIETTIRREMGTDISGACGQLRSQHIKEVTKSGVD
ncbi:dual-specificity RNA methyltransferase RlmN [Clostridium sp. DL1XJH146]